MWKDIPEYEGYYQINELGEVKSCERYIDVNMSDGSVRQRLVREKIMKSKYTRQDQQLVVGLSVEGKVENKYVRQWLQSTFCSEKVFLKYKDGNGLNCTLDNLVFIDKSIHQPISFDHDKLLESDLTQDLLKECFDYSEEGQLIWKERPINHFTRLDDWRRATSEQVGRPAGYYNKRTDSKRDDFGYWRTAITLGNAFWHFKLHRLIFLWHKGYLPKVVDHKDCNTDNNRIENLREGTAKENSRNLRINVSNTSGYKGVNYAKGRIKRPWRSLIEADGVAYFLGSYASKEEAACAYNIAARFLHKDFARLNDTPFKECNFNSNCKFFTQTLPQLIKAENEVLEGNINGKKK